MKKLFLLMFLGIFFLSFTSAEPLNLTLPFVDTLNIVNEPSGVIINVTYNTSLSVITKSPLSNGSVASLYLRGGFATGSLLQNVSFVGNNATFNYDLNTTSTYLVVVSSGGSSYYSRYSNQSGSPTWYPLSNKQITVNWTVRLNANEFRDYTDNIEYIYTDNSTAPTVTLYSPVNEFNTTIQTNYLIANVSTNGASITNVSLIINGTINQTNTSGFATAYNFTIALPYAKWNWTIQSYASSNEVTLATARNISVLRANLVSNTYDPFVIEQTLTNFYSNFTLSSGLSISGINLTYNQTNYSATFSAVNSSFYNVSVSLTTPLVIADINKTFNWTIGFTDGTFLTTSSYQQRVLDFSLDDCGANTIMIFNFSHFDEDLKANLSNTALNTTINLNVLLYPNGSKITPTINFSNNYNEINPARVCISDALGSSIFYTDVEVQYFADTYNKEYYNIQNYSLNASSNPSQNITLYNLAINNSQNFTITYKDSSFLPVADALIQVQRKYVSEGVFTVVEIPITDINGQAVASLVNNNVLYSFTVTKDGEVLGVFSDVYAVCQNPSINDCNINLNSYSSTIPSTDFSQATDFVYTLTYDNSTRTITSIFSIPSGSVSSVYLNVTTENALGTSVCNQSVISSTGTLNCVVGSSFGNTTVLAKLYKNGNLIAQGQIKLDQDARQIYQGIQITLALFLMFTLIGVAMSDSPVFTVISLMVGVILLFILNLVDSTGYYGAGATILFLIIAIILIIVKRKRV